MEKKLKLPIGIENFSELRKRNYYYVDKTELIEQVLEDGSQVILFTRPRRFGKSLNMSMLKSFFEKETDPALFEGLYIAQNIELCRQYMGQYPVISISLKGVDSNSYEGAYKLLVQSICDEIERFQFLIESNELTQIDKKRYFELIDRKMEPDTLAVSLKGLTLLLEKHYHQKVVVLIDEYDVPLAKAYENGYYDEMILLIRNLFGNVLKTNDSLAFAVLTGCLRIAKESIFTGLNNFKVYSSISNFILSSINCYFFDIPLDKIKRILSNHFYKLCVFMKNHFILFKFFHYLLKPLDDMALAIKR